LGFAPRATVLNERRQHGPLRVRQNLHLASYPPSSGR
jgi:hypothetical protein